MYRSLLVPLDGSPFGEQALPLALSIARRAGTSLKLLHVHTIVPVALPSGPVYLDESLDLELKKQEQTYLEWVVKRLREPSSVPVTCELLEGTVADAIRTAATGTEADLVVMTTHGRGALGRFWLGSVVDDLIRHSPTRLLLVRPRESPPDFTHEPVLKHILLPLDGSALAEQMLEPALALGNLMDADYTLLRVIKPVLPNTSFAIDQSGISVFAQSMIDQMERTQEQLRCEAQENLEQIAERLRARSLRVKVCIATGDQPGVAILEHADKSATDLIALETHGRRGLSRLLLGSVADKVIRGASVPVLVQRPVYE